MEVERGKLSFLDHGGDMGNLIQQKDWKGNPLGPPEHWPSILRTVLGTVLKSGFPMALLWGPELIVLYNDAYRSGIGPKGKHPWILGSETREAWSGIWDEIGPLIRLVLNGKESVYRENERFKIERNGLLEDT